MPSSKPEVMEWLHRQLAFTAASISALFNESVKVSILVRNPAHPDGTRGVLLTEDDPPAIKSAIILAEKRPENDYPGDTE